MSDAKQDEHQRGRTPACKPLLLGKLQQPRAQYLLIAAVLLLVAPRLLRGSTFGDHRIVAQTADELVRRAFVHPLGASSQALDLLLWRKTQLAMHLHSLVWLALLLTIARRTYLTLSEKPFIAAVAPAMFAIGSAHGISTGWLSSREALLGCALGIASLLSHHLHRIGQGERYAPLAWTYFVLGLWSSDLAIGTAGYLFAYALCFDHSAPRQRAASMLPYATVTAGWLWMRHSTHDGVLEIARLSMAPERVIVLLAKQVGGVCAHLFALQLRAQQPVLLIASVATCGLALFAAWPALRTNHEARFWAWGTAFSVLLLAAAAPFASSLTPVGLGAMGTFAHLLEHALQAARTPGRHFAGWLAARRRDVALALAFIHLVLDALLLPWFALMPSVLAEVPRETGYAIEMEAGAGSAHTTVTRNNPDSASASISVTADFVACAPANC